MVKNSILQRTILIITLFFVISVSKPVKTSAQTSKGLTVIPPKFELFANPGDTISERLRLRNESDFPVTYTVLSEDFSSSGEEGAVTLEGETADPNFALATWLTPETNDITLQPKEEKTFTFSVAVPKEAEPGGHYASLLFSSGTEPVPGSAAVTSRIGSLVLLRVSGNVTEDANVENFTAPSYSKSGPIPFDLRLKNNGNVHIRPKGTIVITNLFNQKVAEIPLQGANVLPGAVRKMETMWDKTNPLGIYTATLVATYGQQNLPLTAATRFTAISPVAAILITVALVAGIIFLISLFTGRGRLKKAFKAFTSNS